MTGIVLANEAITLPANAPWYVVFIMTTLTGVLGLATVWVRASAVAVGEKARAEAQVMIERAKSEARERTEHVEAELKSLQIESQHNTSLLSIMGDLVKEISEGNRISSAERREFSVAIERNNTTVVAHTDQMKRLVETIEALERRLQALPDLLQDRQTANLGPILTTLRGIKLQIEILSAEAVASQCGATGSDISAVQVTAEDPPKQSPESHSIVMSARSFSPLLEIPVEKPSIVQSES